MKPEEIEEFINTHGLDGVYGIHLDLFLHDKIMGWLKENNFIFNTLLEKKGNTSLTANFKIGYAERNFGGNTYTMYNKKYSPDTYPHHMFQVLENYKPDEAPTFEYLLKGMIKKYPQHIIKLAPFPDTYPSFPYPKGMPIEAERK